MVDVYIILIVLANVLFYVVSLACVWLMRRRVQRLETDDAARALHEALIDEYVTAICCTLLNCIGYANVTKHHHVLLSRFGLIAHRPQNIVLMRRRGTIVSLCVLCGQVADCDYGNM